MLSRRLPGAVRVGSIGGAMALLWIGLACAEHPMRVAIDYDRNVRIPTAGKYAYLAERVQIQPDPRMNRAAVEARVSAAIDEELAAKGYEKSDRAAADLLVGFHVVLDSKLDARMLNDKYGYGETYAWGYGPDGKWGFGPKRQVSTYEHGALIIDIVDSQASRLLWRGSAEGQIKVAADDAERNERVRAAVRNILARFPPRD